MSEVVAMAITHGHRDAIEYGLSFFKSALKAIGDAHVMRIEETLTGVLLSRLEKGDMEAAVKKLRGERPDGGSIKADQDRFMQMMGV